MSKLAPVKVTKQTGVSDIFDALDDAHRHAYASLTVLQRLAETSAVATDDTEQKLFWQGIEVVLDGIVTDDFATIRKCADRLFEIAKQDGGGQ